MARSLAFGIALCVLSSIAFAQGAAADEQARRATDEEIQRTFFQSQSAHFAILFEGPHDTELASRALEVLEDAYFRIGSALYTFPDEPITVVLYTQEQFRDVTRAPMWAAGAYDGRIRVPLRGALEQPDELARVLSHELAHAMIQTIAPRGVPLWLNEGLAVTFEPHGREWADTELARANRRIPLDRLARGFSQFSGDDARLVYAQSAVIARTLVDEGGGATMVTILKDLAGGVPFKTAYEQRLFLPYSTFAESFESSR